jgi:hypothetical protein
MGNHGIPFLEGEPVGDADWRNIRIWLSFRSSRILKPLSGGPLADQPGDGNFEAEFVQGTHQSFDPITRSLRGYRDNSSNSLPEAVYRLITKDYTPTYNSFASTGFAPGSPTTYTSLENIHGSIHVFTGGTGPTRTGYMTHVSVAAFDPIFWLHHKYGMHHLNSTFSPDTFASNVERIACIWQDLHPGNDPGGWLDPNDNGGTDGADPTADLWPFHMNQNGDHYTSDAIRDWRPLGYTYPGLENGLIRIKRMANSTKRPIWLESGRKWTGSTAQPPMRFSKCQGMQSLLRLTWQH